MAEKQIKEVIEIPEEVDVLVDNNSIRAKGLKGETSKIFENSEVKFKKDGNSIIFYINGTSRKQKSLINSVISHFQNMLEGVQKGFVYKLKICSGHFPMTVTSDNKKIVIKNFLGEKISRSASIFEGVNVKIEGDLVIVESLDKEKASQVSANLEQATRILHRDRRRFQDGIFLISRSGKPVR